MYVGVSEYRPKLPGASALRVLCVIGPRAMITALAMVGACSSADDASTTGADTTAPFFDGFIQDSGGGSSGTNDSGTNDSGAGTDGSDAASDGEGAGGDGHSGGDGNDPREGDADAGGSGFEYPCEPGTIESCITVCESPGVRKCLKEWGPCVPLAETCGNCKDDDCNGVIDDNCPGAEECNPPFATCPVAVISVAPGASVDVGTTLQLSAAGSSAQTAVSAWAWAVSTPAGSSSNFLPSAEAQSPSFTIDVAGQFVFELRVWDVEGVESCVPAVIAVNGKPFPPAEPEVGCADGEREGFLDQNAYPQIAACSGAWTQPGITPDSVAPTCNRQGGDDGPNPDGGSCSSGDLCAAGWHVCNGWQEVAAKSPTGCAGAVPQGAPSKSFFFAIRQPSENNIVCGPPGSGVNDVFGCGNLGVGLGPDKNCGPLDRALASTQADKCGFNEAEPPHGPWQCIGGAGSDIKEGQFVTKKGCPNNSCSYDGQPVGSSLRGGVICCRD